MKTVRNMDELRALALERGAKVAVGGQRFNTTGVKAPPRAGTSLPDSVGRANMHPSPTAPAPDALASPLGAVLVELGQRLIDSARPPDLAPVLDEMRQAHERLEQMVLALAPGARPQAEPVEPAPVAPPAPVARQIKSFRVIRDERGYAAQIVPVYD